MLSNIFCNLSVTQHSSWYIETNKNGEPVNVESTFYDGIRELTKTLHTLFPLRSSGTQTSAAI